MLLAAYAGDIHRIESLFDQGKRPDLNDNHGWTALHHSVVKGHLQCVKCLLKYSLPEYQITRKQTHEGETALFLACKNENISLEIIRTLVKDDPSCVRISNNESQTPLHIACSLNSSAVVELLVNAQADIDAQDFNNDTPLHIASEVGALDCLQILLYAGADTSICNEWHMNPLYVAVMQQQTSCVRMLLEFMYIDHIAIKSQETPTVLMLAAQLHNKELVTLLLSKGADLYVQSLHGMLAVDYAHEDYDCVKVLLQAMDHNFVDFPIERISVYTHTPIEIVKLTCEIFPNLFAPYALEYLFHNWLNYKEDCIHIIQILLSQLSFEFLFRNIPICINIDTPMIFAEFLDLVDNLVLYGHDIMLCQKHKSKHWSNRSSYLIYLNTPLSIWSLRALSCVNPSYSPHYLMEAQCINRYDISEMPASWEVEFVEEGGMVDKVNSLKHLSRVQLRHVFCNQGFFCYKQFQHALKQLNLPLSLQFYLQYLEGCA